MCDEIRKDKEKNNAIEFGWITLENGINHKEVDYQEYVKIMETPAENQSQTEKWGGIGEMILCSKVLQRPIITVSPLSTEDRRMVTTIYMPDDSSYKVNQRM